MPRRPREYLLRYADQANNDLDRALEKLKQIADIYGETHPEYSAYVVNIATIVLQAQEFLQKFRTEYM